MLYERIELASSYENATVTDIPKANKMAKTINPFSTNVSLTDKPGSWFLPVKCLKNTCGRVTF